MSTNDSDTRLITLVLVLIGLLIVVPGFFMGFGMMGGPMMGGWDHGMWGNGGTVSSWALLGFLLQLLFLVGLVVAGYLVYRGVTGRTQNRDPALEELRLAYARGDLSDEEFESRRQKLREDDRP
jgi:putative membrane protein